MRYILFLAFLCFGQTHVEATSLISSDKSLRPEAVPLVKGTLSEECELVVKSEEVMLNDEISFRKTPQNGSKDAKKLEKVLSDEIDASCYGCSRALKSRYVLSVLFEEDSQKLALALSVPVLNRIKELHRYRLYEIIEACVESQDLLAHDRKSLIQRIKKSDIFPKHCCHGCASVTKRWGWCFSCLGGIGIGVPSCMIHASLLGCCGLFSGFAVGWGCGVLCVANENARMDLVRRCINEEDETKCYQKVAMSGVGCLDWMMERFVCLRPYGTCGSF